MNYLTLRILSNTLGVSSREKGGEGVPSDPAERWGTPAQVNTLSYTLLSGRRKKPPPSKVMPSRSPSWDL